MAGSTVMYCGFWDSTSFPFDPLRVAVTGIWNNVEKHSIVDSLDVVTLMRSTSALSLCPVVSGKPKFDIARSDRTGSSGPFLVCK